MFNDLKLTWRRCEMEKGDLHSPGEKSIFFLHIFICFVWLFSGFFWGQSKHSTALQKLHIAQSLLPADPETLQTCRGNPEEHKEQSTVGARKSRALWKSVMYVNWNTHFTFSFLFLQVGSSLLLHIEKNFPMAEIHYVVSAFIYLQYIAFNSFTFVHCILPTLPFTVTYKCNYVINQILLHSICMFN